MSTSTQTEQRILEGAYDLFSRYGLRNVTMDDIAKNLGVSKKTIYQHFDDKNKIILDLAKAEMQRHQDAFDEFAANSKNSVEEIIQLMNFMGKTFIRLNPLMFYDMQKYYPEAWVMFREFKNQCATFQITNNLEKGKEQGLYRSDLNTKILARMRMEQIELAFNSAVFPPDKFNIAEVQLQLLNHFLHGICTLKGHRMINKYLQIHEEE